MSEYFSEQEGVLENRLGITDPDILKQAETDIVIVRLAELTQKPIHGSFDFEHLKAIHRHLFSDIYPMAGEVRKVDIAKNGSVFCYMENIEAMQQGIFNKLKRNRWLRGLDCKAFVRSLAELSGDLNALHPFREGNGRAIRCFLIQLAGQAGYDLQFENAEIEMLLAADIAAFRGDAAPLTTLYESLIQTGKHESD